MLAHQRFHARALAALQGRYDAVMLTMCISHRVVHPLEARLVEGERLRAREGNACVALQSLLNDGTVALAHDELVEADVHVDIQRFEVVRDMPSSSASGASATRSPGPSSPRRIISRMRTIARV